MLDEIVTLQDAKLHAKINTDSTDSDVTQKIRAASEMLQKYLGVSGTQGYKREAVPSSAKKWIVQDSLAVLGGIPDTSNPGTFTLEPLTLSWTDDDNMKHTTQVSFISREAYGVNTGVFLGYEVTPDPNWKDSFTDVPRYVTFRWVTGHTESTIPYRWKEIVRKMVREWYWNTGGGAVRDESTVPPRVVGIMKSLHTGVLLRNKIVVDAQEIEYVAA